VQPSVVFVSDHYSKNIIMYEYYINTMFMLMQQPYMYYRFNKNTVLTRRVSSYGLPAWVSSELGAICCGVLPEPDL